MHRAIPSHPPRGDALGFSLGLYTAAGSLTSVTLWSVFAMFFHPWSHFRSCTVWPGIDAANVLYATKGRGTKASVGLGVSSPSLLPPPQIVLNLDCPTQPEFNYPINWGWEHSLKKREQRTG